MEVAVSYATYGWKYKYETHCNYQTIDPSLDWIYSESMNELLIILGENEGRTVARSTIVNHRNRKLKALQQQQRQHQETKEIERGMTHHAGGRFTRATN